MIKKIKSIGFAFLIGLAAQATIPSIGLAQTLFEKPDTSPDYSRYTTSEECFVAVRRLAAKGYRNLPYWTDTVVYSTSTQLENPPGEAADVGRACLEKFSVDSIPLEEARDWAQVYLMANRDDDVDRLYMRKYAEAEDSSRVRIFLEHFRLYRDARPVRIDRIKNLFELAVTQIPQDSSLWRIGLYSLIMHTGNQVGDKEFTRDMASRVLTTYEAALPTLDESDTSTGLIKMLALQATQFFQEKDLMDSLAVSTDAYMKLKQAHVSQFLSDVTLADVGLPIGIEAPPIIADHWYKYTDGQAGAYEKLPSFISPVPNTPNLLIFLHGGCHEDRVFVQHGRSNPGEGHCWTAISTLRRLKQSYPSLQITVVVNTHGNVGEASPLSPAEEADTLAAYFLGFHRIPAALAVVDRPNFRLPGLDRRRIDTETENELNYQLGLNSAFAVPGNAILIDKDGKVVEVIQNSRQPESELKMREFLDAIVEQGVSTPGSSR